MKRYLSPELVAVFAFLAALFAGLSAFGAGGDAADELNKLVAALLALLADVGIQVQVFRRFTVGVFCPPFLISMQVWAASKARARTTVEVLLAWQEVDAMLIDREEERDQGAA